MNQKQMRAVAIIMLMLALVGLLVLAFSPVGTIIRIITASVGITACVIVWIINYVNKKRHRYGK